MQDWMERDTEGIGEEMGQGLLADAPAEASGMPSVIGWAGWVAAAAVVGTDEYFHSCYRMYFTEKYLEI